jgi:hypothetical protein
MSEEILKLLGELGATAQDVAARLGAERIKARKGATSFQNPIVRYVKRHLEESGPFYVPVLSGLMTVVHNGRWYTVELPAPVFQFLDRFHAGEFPRSARCNEPSSRERIGFPTCSTAGRSGGRQGAWSTNSTLCSPTARGCI